jgi:hypothetical protein
VVELRYLAERPLGVGEVAEQLAIGPDEVARLETAALERLALERELQALREAA